MNNKKKMVLGAAFIVAIMALAGVGYATLFSDTYKGTAESKTQEYDVDYVIVTLGGSSYSTLSNLYIVYDTVTTHPENADVTTFKWKGSTAVSHTVTATVPDDEKDGQDPDDLKLKVDVTFSVTGYKLQYKVGDGTWTTYTAESAIHATGEDVTPGNAITIAWRAVPTDIADSNAPEDGGDEGITLTTAVPNQGVVTLPAITYTVEATQA